MVNALILIYIFGAALFSLLLIVISFILVMKGINKIAFTLFFPSFITIVVTFIKYSEISRNAAGGGDFKGFAVFGLPMLGLIVFGISFLITIFLQAVWIGIAFIERNINNKDRRLLVILVSTMVIISPLPAVYLYKQGLPEYQERVVADKETAINDLRFWENVFITNNASLPIDTYNKHLSAKKKDILNEPLDIYVTHPSNKNREFIANKLHDDYDAKISSELLTVLYRLGFGVGSHPNIGPILAKELYQKSLNGYPNYVALQSLARNLGTTEIILEKISDHESPYVLKELAMNESASVDILEKLISRANEKIDEENKKQNPEVYNINMQTEILKRAQETLAKQPDTPASRLKELADINIDIRKAVASNPSAPIDLLEELAKDSEASVGSRALVSLGRSPKTKNERLTELSQNNDEWVRAAVAENKAAPKDLLITLLQDKYTKVSYAALKNLSAKDPVPEEILRKFLDRLDRGSLTSEAHLPKWLRNELIRKNKDSCNEISYYLVGRLPVNDYSDDELKEVVETAPQCKINISKSRETPIRILNILSMDSSKDVSDAAKATLKSFEVEL